MTSSRAIYSLSPEKWAAIYNQKSQPAVPTPLKDIDVNYQNHTVQLNPPLPAQADSVQALVKKRFDETKLTKEYGFLETLKFSIVMPIKSKLSSLFGGKLGTSLTPEEQKELELYQQNQAFHKQIGKVVTAYSNYRSAILKSEFALPEQAAAAATAEHDRAQELKGAYDALLNLAADQAEKLAEGDQMKAAVIRQPDDDATCIDYNPRLSPTDIKELNEARRKELHSALNLINPSIISLVHRSKSMLSVVDKVGYIVNYNQEKLLDFLAYFDATVEESLTQMGFKEGSESRKTEKEAVKINLMRGLRDAPGFGLIASVDAVAEICKNRNPNEFSNKTRQEMLEHFTNELNRVGNIPLNPSSIDTPEKLAQHRVELEKTLKGIHFQGMPLINTNNSSFICSRVTSMQLNAYKLKNFEEKIESLNDEYKELTDQIAAADALIDEQVNFTVEEFFEFLPVGLVDFSLINAELEDVYKLKYEISRLRKIDSDAIDAKLEELRKLESEASALETSRLAIAKSLKIANAELEQKTNNKKELVKQDKEFTKGYAKLAATLGVDVQATIDSSVKSRGLAIDEEIRLINIHRTGLIAEDAKTNKAIQDLVPKGTQLEDELADLKTNGINKVHRDTLEEAVQKYDADKTSTVTLEGRHLLNLKETIPRCREDGAVAEYLAFVNQVNTKADELFKLAENTTKQLASAKTDLMGLKMTIVNGGDLNIDVDELTKVNELAIIPEEFFTKWEQQDMEARLADSRTRTLDLTYKISKNLLAQELEDNIHRPYVKDQTAKQRNSETAARAGGLSRSGEKAYNLYQTISSGYGAEDNGSDESSSSARSSLDGFGESYVLASKTPTVYPPPLTQSFENFIENSNDEEFFSDVENDDGGVAVKANPVQPVLTVTEAQVSTIPNGNNLAQTIVDDNELLDIS
jgi:hypothetical protein